MKKTVKSVIGIILLVSLLCPAVFAADTVAELSLDDAIALAKANSKQIESCNYEIKSGEISVDAAEYSQYDMRKVPASSVEILYVKRGYYLEASNVSLKLAELKKKQTEDSICYKVTENYYNCVLSEQLVEIAQNTYNLALENKNVVSKYFELGMVSDLEIKNADLAVKGALHAKNGYEQGLDIARKNLNISLGVPTENVYKLTDEIVEADSSLNLEADIEKALKTRYDMTAAKENANLAKLYFDITGKFYTNNTAPYNTAYSKLITAENDYENALLQMDLYIRTLYNSAISSKTAVEIAETTLEIEKTEYDAAKLKFEMGMITNMELTTALNDMNKAETELWQAKLNLLLSGQKYKYETSYGL